MTPPRMPALRLPRARGLRFVAVLAALLPVALLAVAAAAAAQATGPAAGAGARGVTLILVREWTWAQARPVAAAAGRPVAAGFISTLPPGAAVTSRALSLAAGRRTDTQALGDGTGPAQVEQLRADNADAALSGLPPTRILAAPGMEDTGVIALAAGQPAATEPVPPGGPLAPEPGNLLVIAVPNADRAAALLPRLPADGRILLAGLEPTPGRARSAPYLDLGGAAGLVTSDGTRRDGLVALEDVRVTIEHATGQPSGDQVGGARVQAEPHDDPLAAVDAIDRRVAALVAARTWAIPLVVLLGATAFGATFATLRGDARGAPAPRRRRTARGFLLVTAAVPAGYLAASWIAPPWPAVWLATGMAAAIALAAAAARTRTAAPGVLGLAFLALVTADLATGGEALARPLIGGSAFDGERFYGIGNGAFGYALAAAMLACAFLPLSRAAGAALLAALALVAGLPSLGADVGGGLTGMIAAAAVWLLLDGRRPRAGRVALLAVAAVAAGLVVALGVGALAGDQTHGTQFVEQVAAEGPAAAARVFAHKVEVNAALLAHNPFAWVGPALVALAAVAAVRRPFGLAAAPARAVRAVQTGVVGAISLIVINDTGVTAAIGCGLLLLVALAWSLPAITPLTPSTHAGHGQASGSNPTGLAALARLARTAARPAQTPPSPSQPSPSPRT